MPTSYTSNLRLALPASGELEGTWGNVVNDNITSMVEQAIAGLVTINSWTANSHTLTTANGTTDESRAAILVLTDSGVLLSGAGTLTCPSVSKFYIVKNSTGQQITVTTSGGSGIAVPSSQTMWLFCDGTNVEEATNYITTLSIDALTAASATVNGNITVTGTVDGRDVAADGTKLDTLETNAKDDQVASEVPFTPTGGITASDVQTAIAELDTEKEPADPTILKDADIGVTVQGYDATTLKSADIGVTVQGYDATTLKSADIGVTVQAAGNYEPADATILKDADIGVTVQGYDADTTKNNIANTFTANQNFEAEIQLNGSAGTSGQVLTSSGSGVDPVWADPMIGFSGSEERVFKALGTAGTITDAGLGIPYIAALSDTSAVIVYNIISGDTYLKAVAVTISGDSVSFGTPVLLSAVAFSGWSPESSLDLKTIDSTRAILVGSDSATDGSAVVLTVTGSSVTWGTPITYRNQTTGSRQRVAVLSADKVLVVTENDFSGDGDEDKLYGRVLEVSGNTLTQGSAQILTAGSISALSLTNVDTSRALVSYSSGGNTYAGVLSVSGTVITAEPPYVISISSSYRTEIVSLSSTSALILYTTPSDTFFKKLTISGISVSAPLGQYVMAGAGGGFVEAISVGSNRVYAATLNTVEKHYIIDITSSGEVSNFYEYDEIYFGFDIVSSMKYSMTSSFISGTKTIVCARPSFSTDTIGVTVFNTPTTIELTPSSPQLQVIKSYSSGASVKLPSTASLNEGAYPFVVQAKNLGVDIADNSGTLIRRVPPSHTGLCALSDSINGKWSVSVIDDYRNPSIGSVEVTAASSSCTKAARLTPDKFLRVYDNSDTLKTTVELVSVAENGGTTVLDSLSFDSPNPADNDIIGLTESKAVLIYNSFSAVTVVVVNINSATGTLTAEIAGQYTPISASEYVSVAKINAKKAVICYRSGANTVGRVLSVSDSDVITGGTEVTVATNTGVISMDTLDHSRLIVSVDFSAQVLTVSGVTLTAGASISFPSTNQSRVVALSSSRAFYIRNSSIAADGCLVGLLAIDGDVVTFLSDAERVIPSGDVYNPIYQHGVSATLLSEGRVFTAHRSGALFGNTIFIEADVLYISPTILRETYNGFEPYVTALDDQSVVIFSSATFSEIYTQIINDL